MTGIKIFKLNFGRNIHFAVIRKRNDLVGRLQTIFFVEEGIPIEFFALFAGLFLKVFRITSLNSGAVHHNQISEVTGGRRCINIAVVALFYEKRQKTYMVVVGMSKNNGVDFINRNFKIPVLFVGLGSLSLKSAAVNHVRTTVDFKNMF